MPNHTAQKFAEIATVVKVAREGAGLSQAELAERLAFSRNDMVDLESGYGNL